MSRKINVCNGKSRSVPASAGIKWFVHKIVSEWYRVCKWSREVLFKPRLSISKNYVVPGLTRNPDDKKFPRKWDNSLVLSADGTTSHSTDETTSHPTKQPKDGCQVVGYKTASGQVAGYTRSNFPARFRVKPGMTA